MRTFHTIFQLKYILFIEFTSVDTDPDYNQNQSTESTDRNWKSKFNVQIIWYFKKSYSDDFENSIWANSFCNTLV